ncbi:hypothetical protein NPIL_201551 [Nephila pilipes]|uniref:Tetratricopeptide repeat protein n=1 Tax=Nephila pilipes TaxID=299642 RepID=A0A8X6KBS0_NEPPI|nr:hypothetical protein NPIL_201551 [Nephila pilipes]
MHDENFIRVVAFDSVGHENIETGGSQNQNELMALEYFKKAEEITPLFYSMNLLMLGKCYINLNDKERGIEYLKKVCDYTIKTPDDQKAHDEAEKLLKGLNI